MDKVGQDVQSCCWSIADLSPGDVRSLSARRLCDHVEQNYITISPGSNPPAVLVRQGAHSVVIQLAGSKMPLALPPLMEARNEDLQRRRSVILMLVSYSCRDILLFVCSVRARHALAAHRGIEITEARQRHTFS